MIFESVEAYWSIGPFWSRFAFIHCLNCSNFGQLILRKITKIVATSCHILRPTLIVPYELYELYDWGKVPELYGTL